MRFFARTTALTLLVLALTAATASAHRDTPVDPSAFDLAPGASLPFPVPIHYHRLVGEVQATNGEARATLVRAEGGSSIPLGSGAAFRINTLVPCCDDRKWTDYALVVANDGPAPILVRLRVVALHDGLAVAAHDAEPGSAAFTLAWVLGCGALFSRGVFLRRAPPPGPAGPWALAAAGLHALLWVLGGALGLVGVLRYGGGFVAGTLAATATWPATGNDFVNAHALVVLGLLVLWAASMRAWAGAAARAIPGDRLVVVVSLVLAAGAAAAGLALAVETDAWAAPLLFVLAAAAFPLAFVARTLRARRVLAP